MGFSIERHVEADGTVRLILFGDADLAARDSLRAALVAEHVAGTSVIVVLDQLDYLDSAGIGELLRASWRAREAGRHLAITPGSGNVRHLLSISGVLSDLCPDAAGAPNAARWATGRRAAPAGR